MESRGERSLPESVLAIAKSQGTQAWNWRNVARIPSPLWGGVRGGVETQCAVADECSRWLNCVALGSGTFSMTAKRNHPHPCPSPQRGGNRANQCMPYCDSDAAIFDDQPRLRRRDI